MKEIENLLDDGALYQEPEINRLDMPALDREESIFQHVETTPLKSKWYHYFNNYLIQERKKLTDENVLLFKSIQKKEHYLWNFAAVAIIAFGVFQTPTNFFLIPAFFLAMFLANYLRPTSYFDKFEGLHWKKAEIPFYQLFRPNEQFPVKLTDIRAVQLLKKQKVRGKHTYEVNLVLINNERINIMAHQEMMRITNDAENLADFLNVPLLSGEEE